MNVQDRLAKPVERYIHHGDLCPPADKLAEVISFLQSDLGRPKSRLILADVFIDLAMASGDENEQALDRASDMLGSVIDDVALMEEGGFRREQSRFTCYAASAALRLGELASWGEASREQPIRPDYENFLLHT